MDYTLHKVDILPKELIAGHIYFIDKTGQIAVAESADKSVIYGGNIIDAEMKASVLTLRRATGDNIIVDLSDVASASDISNQLTALNNQINEKSEDIRALNAALSQRPTNSDVQDLIHAALSSVLKYKGTKDSYSDLPSTDNMIGDTWNVINPYNDIPAGTNWAWDGTGWDPLGGIVDMSAYFNSLAINGSIVPVLNGTLSFAKGKADGYLSINGTEVQIVDMANIAGLLLANWGFREAISPYIAVIYPTEIGVPISSARYNELCKYPIWTVANTATSGDITLLYDKMYIALDTNDPSVRYASIHWNGQRPVLRATLSDVGGIILVREMADAFSINSIGGHAIKDDTISTDKLTDILKLDLNSTNGIIAAFNEIESKQFAPCKIKYDELTDIPIFGTALMISEDQAMISIKEDYLTDERSDNQLELSTICVCLIISKDGSIKRHDDYLVSATALYEHYLPLLLDQITQQITDSISPVQASINELQIGGVNYINATNQGVSFWEVYQGAATGWTTEEAKLLGQRGVTMSGVNGQGKLLFYYPRQSTSLGYMYSALREGDDVVVSFDAETANIRSINMSVRPSNGSSAQEMVTFDDSVASIKADGLAHYEWHGKVTANVSLRTQIVYMHVYPRETDMPMTITIANLQLERGTRSTSWTPSQVDIDNLLASTVKTTDKGVVAKDMIADNAVTPEKLSTTTKEMFVRTMVPQTLTAAQQNTARNNISAMAATPSGDPMHYMYELLGATWNADTNYWEIGYVKDITAEQMRLIYLWSNDNNVPAANQRFRTPSTVRVIVNLNAQAQGSMQSMFYNCAGAELITLAATITVSPSTGFQSTFYNSTKLQEITGTLDLHLVTTTAAMTNAFYNCTSLREVRLYKLTASGLDLSATGVLSAASVRYLVENAANTAEIVVYVSPTTMSNITAGAGDWAGIAAAASAKDIRFELAGGSRAVSADDDNVLQYIEEGE